MAISKVLMVSAEVEPFAKTGGLGDVVGALPQALKKIGIDCRVIMPLYRQIDEKYRQEMKYLGYIYVDLKWRHQYCGIYMLKKDKVYYYFIDNEFYYHRETLYDELDTEKYAFLDMAAFHVAKYVGFKPDIIHIHDWHTGPIAALLNDYFCYDPFFKDTKSVYTIHNIAYQGIADKGFVLDLLPLNEEKYQNTNVINFMALGIQYAYKVNTVSPSYAKEILTDEYGEGMQYLLKDEKDKVSGILNGINYDIYSPNKDNFIDYKYSNKNVFEGKQLNKLSLLKTLGFNEDSYNYPLIGVVSRLASQKGMNLLLDIIDRLINDKVNIVLLGSGSKDLENAFKEKAAMYPNNFKAILKFDNSLAHKIYASSDMFLMPSAFEPCGLAQLICLKYGTVPIVRSCGGLKDSIISYNIYNNVGNGFSFESFNANDFYNTIKYAISLYNKKATWHRIIRNGLKEDYSWKNSAEKYKMLYESI